MYSGTLEIVAGGIDAYENVYDAAKNEVREETGLRVTAFFPDIRTGKYAPRDDSWVDGRELRRIVDSTPEQIFTLEFLGAFGIYPVGYDNHICEYLPFFYSKDEWEELGYHTTKERVLQFLETGGRPDAAEAAGTVDDVEVQRILGKGKFPFPKDPEGPYYRESPVKVMEALLTGREACFDALVVPNNGCVSNLPHDAIVDIPAVVAGGRPRGMDVGELPFFAAELCRRQIGIHELIAEAAVTGERRLLLEALCLDPYVRGLTTARKIMEDYLAEYRDYLPQFHQ